MCSAILAQVRQDKVRILVHLIWILWTETRLCCEREFCDTVVKFLCRGLCWICRWRLWYRFRCSDFPSYRSPNSIAIPTISSLLGVSIRCGRMVWILSLFLGWLASFLPFAYFSELVDCCMLFGLRTISLHVLFTYLEWLAGRCV